MTKEQRLRKKALAAREVADAAWVTYSAAWQAYKNSCVVAEKAERLVLSAERAGENAL